jgi:hypothetical protein
MSYPSETFQVNAQGGPKMAPRFAGEELYTLAVIDPEGRRIKTKRQPPTYTLTSFGHEQVP